MNETNDGIDSFELGRPTLIYLGIDPNEPIRIGLDELPLLPSEYGGDNDPEAERDT